MPCQIFEGIWNTIVLDVIRTVDGPVKATLGSPCDPRTPREVPVVLLATIQERPAGPHPAGPLSLTGGSAPVCGRSFLPSLARRRYNPRNGRSSQVCPHSRGAAPGIVEAPGQAWQVTRIDLWKELTLGVLAKKNVQRGFKGSRAPEFAPVLLLPTRQIRRPRGLESLRIPGPRSLRAKEIELLAAVMSLRQLCAPRCKTCIRPSTIFPVANHQRRCLGMSAAVTFGEKNLCLDDKPAYYNS